MQNFEPAKIFLFILWRKWIVYDSEMFGLLRCIAQDLKLGIGMAGNLWLQGSG